MHGNESAASPQQVREAARAASYPNSKAEALTVSEVDRAAANRVRLHENLLKTEATDRLLSTTAMLGIADELDDMLTYDIRAALDNGAAPDAELTRQYQQVESNITRMIADLESAATNAEFLADRLSDPAGDMEKILQRFPALRRHIL